MSAENNPYRRMHRQAIAVRDFTRAAHSLTSAALAVMREYYGEDVLKEDVWDPAGDLVEIREMLDEAIRNIEMWSEATERLADHTEREFRLLAGDLDKE